MLKHYPYNQLGHANYHWLDTRYHFSFARYYNPERMGFGTLRVINDDIIEAGAGFDMHSHKNMEIITFVRQGAITHIDSKGNAGRTEAGDVQVMSAGTGIHHSEFNKESEDTHIFQIWITPKKNDVEPEWGSYHFPKVSTQKELTLLVSGNQKAPLTINQDAFIYGGNVSEGTTLTHSVKYQAYLLISDGSIEIESHILKKGDGMEVTHISSITFTALSDTKILIIDVPIE